MQRKYFVIWKIKTYIVLRIGTNKERVNFGEVIGQYVNPATNEAVDTTMGIIHYSKTGTHIVPAQPMQ